MNIYTALLACFLGIQYYTSQVSDQSSERNEFDTAIANHVVDHDLDSIETRMFACNPPFQVMGLYDPNVPLSPNTAIFADPLVKAEIMSDGFQGKDKEYGDIDNDGLIDILYTKNDNELWYIPNTGTLSVPDYQVSNAVQTLFTNVFSFRLVDWFNDGVLDLLLLEDHGIRQINLYSNIHTQLGAPASIGLLDNTQFPLRIDQLIEAGDVDGDGDMDVLISGQDPGLEGTAFLEQLQGPAPFYFPYLQLAAGQTLPLSPMIPDNIGSYHTPEMYDADCDGDLDLFISDPLLLTAGGHVDYYENTGSGSPFLYFTQQSANPYGLVDIPGDDLRCDFVILRFVDFFGDGCPEAISYNPCGSAIPQDIYFYKNNCSCEAGFEMELLDNCGKFLFTNTSSGPTPMSCFWDFDDPGSGINNTSVQCQEMHQFSTCGTYNVCLTITAPGCMKTICHPVTVSDNVPPVALCKNNVVLLLNANCIANVSPTDIDAGSFDDCSLSLYDVTPSSFSQCGTFPVTLTVTDWCGNTNTCNTVVQVVDNIPPVITCPADFYLTTISSNCMIVANGLQWITLSDNCGVPIVSYTVTGASNYVGIGDASGLNFNQGISTITYIATDQCGNSSSCSFLITIDCFCICPGNLLLNGGFTSGTTVGDMAQNGSTNFWNLATESPQISGSDFCCDANSIQMWGRTYTGESIYQSNVPILAGHHYKISFCGKYLDLNPNAGYAQFGFTGGPIPTSGTFNPFNCTNCENAGSSSNISSTSWNSYTLPIWTPTQNWDRLYVRVFRNSNIQTWGRIDNICLEEVQYICCEDEQEFIENTDNSTNTYPQSETREGVFEVGNLMECNTLDYINWGDGSIIDGPIFGNTTLRHTYAETGSYEVQYQVREFDPQDTSHTACFEHIFIDDIVILPDTCFCGGFSNMYFRSINAPPGIAVNCGEAPVQVNCPSSNLSLQFTGLFQCKNVGGCSDSSFVEWKLIRLPNHTVAGGNIIASPFYDLSILPSWYALPGTYEIQLKGACGTNSCTCSVQFIVDCPEACICDPQDFQKDLNRGFSTTLFENNCEACFSSILLTDCDLIEWSIDGVSLGSTIGDIMFFHTFSADGTYAVKMAVTRFNADGTVCQIGTVTQDIMIKCGSSADCQNSNITNPDFNLGAVAGGINSGGVSQGWSSVSGEPIVVEGEMGSTDGWSIQLDGNFDSSSILTTLEPVCLEKTSGNATLRFKIKQGSGKDMLVLKLYRFDAFDAGDCNSETCYVIEDQKATPPPDRNQWVDLTFPYDLSDWLISDDCGVKPSVRVRPALYFFNHLSDDQGGIDTKTIIAVDNFCLGGMTVALSEPMDNRGIRIFPNPTTGSLNIEMPYTGESGMTIQLISLTGQHLLEKAAEPGSAVQTLDASGLPQGMYFLQIFSKGQVIAVNKFVKL